MLDNFAQHKLSSIYRIVYRRVPQALEPDPVQTHIDDLRKFEMVTEHHIIVFNRTPGVRSHRWCCTS